MITKAIAVLMELQKGNVIVMDGKELVYKEGSIGSAAKIGNADAIEETNMTLNEFVQKCEGAKLK